MRKKYKFNTDQLHREDIHPDNKLDWQLDDNDKNILKILSPNDIKNISSDFAEQNNIVSDDKITAISNKNLKYDLQNDEFDYDKFINNFNQLPSPLDQCNEDISYLGPGLSPTFNFAAYADRSELIQTYVKLGVELYKLENNQDHMRALLTVDLKKELPKYLQFFHDSGIAADDFGKIITMCPIILKEDIVDMETRLRYLRAHKFTQPSIARIITKNPTWLTWATKHIDERLGHFQNEFKLSGSEIRFLATKQPKIITYNMKHINENTFAFIEEMGFGANEAKIILLTKPRIWMQNRAKTLKTFEYVHRSMNLSHDIMLSNIEVLSCRVNRLKNRHEFLLELNKVQYDPKSPGYISLKAIVNGSDEEFCKDVAKSSIETYNQFLKTR
ncbi:PREDICTED: transcription termination factor 3, mitochondrial [Ceratosolen solmsi marchali]|uniref:Transcription termination factor 3, mitochondrial n=1 Tax=Ceratosolen solmsi marchali TaxID=326594 RepID=A0AAJ6YPA3_9HYME|nr:PREDICTED: transcription termination factor 3, mitochondrial [Ceratosolen solmsi marchali]